MSKPWGTTPARSWAADVEAEDEERKKNPHLADESSNTSFPSLKEAVSAKPQKKKKQQTMSLSEFTTGTNIGPGSASRRDFLTDSRGLTTDELRMLPTGPRERSGEEMEFGRGGFRGFSGGRGPPGGGERRDTSSSWGGGGGGGRRSYGEGFDDERRSGAPPQRELDTPSRADEVDNWAMGKKTAPPMDYGRGGGGDARGDRGDRYSALGGGSRADEVDNWAMGKKPLPVRSSSTSFGSGFRDRERERDPVGGGAEPERWGRTGPREGETQYPPLRERTKLVLNPPTGDGSLSESAKSTRPSPFGAARPREEILAEKGLDWKKLDSEIDTKKTTSRPTSAQSSRPSSAHSNQPENTSSVEVLEVVAKPRPRVNPFGDAKPREVLLQEKGMDWRKIDFELEHRSVDRPETAEEQWLKEEIESLKKQLEKEPEVNANEEQTGLQEQILTKERDLELLIRELDDKVRFGQKATERPGSGAGRSSGLPERPGSGGGRSSGYPERPGSGAGRSTGYPERPPSQSGTPDEFRNVEYVDRSHSRGTVNVWSRPVDERRSFPGGREGGFLGNREDSRPRGGGW